MLDLSLIWAGLIATAVLLYVTLDGFAATWAAVLQGNAARRKAAINLDNYTNGWLATRSFDEGTGMVKISHSH